MAASVHITSVAGSRLLRLAILAIGVSSVSGGLQEFVDLVTAVQQYFHSGCIYLLHDHGEHLNTTLATVKAVKLMFRKYIQTTLTSRRNGSAGCQNNRPLFVIPDKDRSLQQDNLSSAIWLKFLEQQSTRDYFVDKDVPFDCEFLTARPGGERQFILSEVYRVRPSYPLQTDHFGSWTSLHGLDKPQIGLNERRSSLLGAVLKTAIKEDSPLLSPMNAETDDLNQAYFFMAVWNTLKELLNFTTEYRFSGGNVNGAKLENGSWNGIIGLMQRKEADVTPEDLSMLPSRAEVVDFMIPLRKDRQYVLMRKSDSFELYWGSFLKPFSTEIWVAVILTILLLSFVLWLIRRERFEGSIVSFHLYDSFFYIFGSFCQQGHGAVPRSLSGRMVCLVSYLTALILMSGYSASLISHLTLREQVFPFTTFSGLMDDGSYKLGVLASSSVFSFFKETKDPVMHKLYTKFIHSRQDTLSVTTFEGLRRVCEEHKYTFMSSLDNLEQYSSDLTCSLIPVPEAFLPGIRAMAVAKDSPYLDLFSHSLLKLYSVGILQRLSLMTFKSSVPEESRFVAMDIVSMSPMFVILAAGVIAAMFLLIVEKVVYKYLNLKDTQPDGRCVRCPENVALPLSVEPYKRRSHQMDLQRSFVQ